MKRIIQNKVAMTVLLVIIVGYAFIWALLGSRQKEVTSFTPEFEENQTMSASAGGASGGIKIPGYSEITVDADKKDVSVNLYNPESNRVYFQMEFLLPDTGETLYTSKLIKPGQHLYNITLNRPLDKGEYDLVIRYSTYTADETMTPRNGAQVSCRLIAK